MIKREHGCDYGNGHTTHDAMRLCDAQYNGALEEWTDSDVCSAIEDAEDVAFSQGWRQERDQKKRQDPDAFDRLVAACKERINDDELQVLVEALAD